MVYAIYLAVCVRTDYGTMRPATVAETSLDILDPEVMVAEDNAGQVATGPLDHQPIGARVGARIREIARSTTTVGNTTAIHLVEERMTGLVAISIVKLETTFYMQESVALAAAEATRTRDSSSRLLAQW